MTAAPSSQTIVLTRGDRFFAQDMTQFDYTGQLFADYDGRGLWERAQAASTQPTRRPRASSRA